jgi:hypothetical protein
MANTEQTREAAVILNAAISAGDLEEVNRLLKQGISAREPDHFGQLPIFVAARDGKAVIAKLLIEQGVDVNAPVDRSGRRPLYWAADGGHVDVVQALIAQGAAIDALDNYGLSALFTAAFGLANEILNVPDPALWIRTQNSHPTGRVAVAETLILAGANVQIAPKQGESAEHFIRAARVPRLIKLMEARAQTAPKRSVWSRLSKA